MDLLCNSWTRNPQQIHSKSNQWSVSRNTLTRGPEGRAPVARASRALRPVGQVISASASCYRWEMGLSLLVLSAHVGEGPWCKCNEACTLGMYRMAQNKIPHRTICNILATSGQILEILEAFNPDTSLNPTVYNIHRTLIIQPHYRVKQLLWKL